MTPEGKVKKQVTDLLKKVNAYYFFPATGGYGRSGVPDIVACYRGRFIAIECKAGKGEPTALQTRELFRVRGEGGIALVIRESTVFKVQELLESIRESH
jgi:Holliday junction resolvase